MSRNIYTGLPAICHNPGCELVDGPTYAVINRSGVIVCASCGGDEVEPLDGGKFVNNDFIYQL